MAFYLGRYSIIGEENYYLVILVRVEIVGINPLKVFDFVYLLKENDLFFRLPMSIYYSTSPMSGDAAAL